MNIAIDIEPRKILRTIFDTYNRHFRNPKTFDIYDIVKRESFCVAQNK